MKIICGVDVSKAKLDACIEPGAAFASFDNTPAGITELAAFCRQHQAELAVMERPGVMNVWRFCCCGRQACPAP